MALKRLMNLRLAAQYTALFQLFFIIGVLVYSSVETWNKSADDVQSGRLSFNVVGYYTAIFGLVGLFTAVELYAHCFNMMRFWVITTVIALYVFGGIMSCFGFAVSLIILLDNEDTPNRDVRPLLPSADFMSLIPPQQHKPLTKEEAEFLLLFMVCLGSLAIIITGRIALAFYTIKAHKAETLRTIRAIRNVGVTFDMSQFPPNSEVLSIDRTSLAASTNPPAYNDCVKEEGSLPRYCDIKDFS